MSLARRLKRSVQGRRRKAQCSEFLVDVFGSQAAMTPPSASGGFVEAQPLIERLLKPPEATVTETTPCALSLESAAPCCCIEKSKLNHTQRHTKKVFVQRVVDGARIGQRQRPVVQGPGLHEIGKPLRRASQLVEIGRAHV